MTRPKWDGKRIDKEIGIMSARSAQRTRWRRWRMGRDIAGGKDREGRLSGLAGTSCRRRRRGGASPSSSSFFLEDHSFANASNEPRRLILLFPTIPPCISFSCSLARIGYGPRTGPLAPTIMSTWITDEANLSIHELMRVNDLIKCMFEALLNLNLLL